MRFPNPVSAKSAGFFGKKVLERKTPKTDFFPINQGDQPTVKPTRHTASSLPFPKSAAVQNLSPATTTAANRTQPSTAKQTPTFSEKMNTHKQKCGSFIVKVHALDPTYIILTGAACVCSGIFLAGAAIYEGIRSRSS